MTKDIYQRASGDYETAKQCFYGCQLKEIKLGRVVRKGTNAGVVYDGAELICPGAEFFNEEVLTRKRYNEFLLIGFLGIQTFELCKKCPFAGTTPEEMAAVQFYE